MIQQLSIKPFNSLSSSTGAFAARQPKWRRKQVRRIFRHDFDFERFKSGVWKGITIGFNDKGNLNQFLFVAGNNWLDKKKMTADELLKFFTRLNEAGFLELEDIDLTGFSSATEEAKVASELANLCPQLKNLTLGDASEIDFKNLPRLLISLGFGRCIYLSEQQADNLRKALQSGGALANLDLVKYAELNIKAKLGHRMRKAGDFVFIDECLAGYRNRISRATSFYSDFRYPMGG